jgi:molecular chaperone Hsp33
VALGVQEAAGGGVAAAAGYLVHALPGASDDETRRAEHNVRANAAPSELVTQGCDALALAARLLDGLGEREPIESEVRFRCNCDADRVAAAVRLLGEQEIARAASRGEALEVRCEFCAAHYTLAPDALRALIPGA